MDTPVLRKVIRFDSTPLNAAYFTEEGYLIDSPILTSTGIFEYVNPDGSIRRELRVPNEVFSTDSLKSYRAKPIIITHDAGLVDKSNVHDASIGTILSDGYRDGNDVRAKIVIHDTDEMKRSGFKELSLGYNLDLDETPGIWNGERYDAIQRNIRINHLALVREARAGDQARLNIDSKDGTTLKGGKLMSKVIRRHGRRADEALSPEELQKAIEWYKHNRDTLEGKDEEEVKIEEKPAEKPEEKKAASIEEQIGSIRENHPVEKDSEDKAPFVLPDKEEKEEEFEEEKEFDAEEVIKDQDKDIKTLLDIIDTLLAERAFDEAEEIPVEEDKKKVVIEDVENEDEDDDIFAEEEEMEDFKEDADDEEELPEEMEDEVIIEEEENEDGDCYGEEEKIMNTDSIDRIVRERVKLGMLGKMLNLDGLEDVGIRTAKKAIIKTVRPKVNLDGKSAAYINALFDCAVEDIKKNTRKDTNYQRRQMFNKDSARAEKDENSSVSARDRMIERHRNKEGK